MDILSLQPSTSNFDLLHPKTGEKLGIKLELQSMQSDEVKAVERRIRNAALRGGRNTTTAEKLDSNSLELLAATIVSWEWPDGLELGELKNPPCTAENKKTFLATHWIAKQIDSYHSDEAAFFKG